MDVTFFVSLAGFLMLAICLFLVLAAVFVRRNQSKVKGYLGERQVQRLLTQLGKDYTVYHDLYVERTDKTTTQIDHVVLSKYGIFVLETKNYKGVIAGEATSRQWTQQLGTRHYPFYNPVRQNYAHVKALQHALGIKATPHSIVVFTNRATLRLTGTQRTDVILASQLTSTMKRYNTVVFSDAQLADWAKKLKKLATIHRKDKQKIKRAHLTHVQALQASEMMNLSCPQCGRPLTLREGKYGTFYGCTGYPSCRYTGRSS